MKAKVKNGFNWMNIKHLIFIILIGANTSYGQSANLRTKPFSIGSNRAGLGFGNSINYSGLRFNFRDRYVDSLNGFVFSIFQNAEISNGISIGGVYNRDDVNNGLSFAVVSNWALKDRNGIAIGGFAVLSPRANGIVFSGCLAFLDKMNGVCISGALILPELGVDIVANKDESNIINGLAVACIGIVAHRLNGVSIAGYNKFNQHYGLSIGVVNKTEKLQGVQFGLINYVGNNPRGLRWLPFINMHFGSKNEQVDQ